LCLQYKCLRIIASF